MSCIRKPKNSKDKINGSFSLFLINFDKISEKERNFKEFRKYSIQNLSSNTLKKLNS